MLESANVAELAAAALVVGGMAYFAAVSVALALIDLEHHRLPNRIVLPAYGVLAVSLWASAILVAEYAVVARSAAGAGIGFGLYLTIALISPRGMGLGDVKLAGVIGLILGWVGWGALAVGLMAGFIFGGVVAIVLILRGKARRGTGIPFGPCMLAGAWFGILFGSETWATYLALAGLG